MARMKKFCLVVILVGVLLITLSNCEIHRAVKKHQPRHRSQSDRSTLKKHSSETWLYSLISAGLVGLSGIFPLLVIPIEAGKALRNGESGAFLKLLLSYAVGALLGDVFLHLLPEAWAHLSSGHDHRGHTAIGLWVLVGLLSFMIIEKVFPDGDHEESEEEEEEEVVVEHKIVANEQTELKSSSSMSPRQRKNKAKKGKTEANGKALLNGSTPNGKTQLNGNAHKVPNGVPKVPNGDVHKVQNGVRKVPNGVPKVANGDAHKVPNGDVHKVGNGHVANGVASGAKKAIKEKVQHIKTSGWLNLMANVIDNFTHGLAVASSYCVSNKVGFVTTVAILLHEIPHEIGDFAILLRAGFDRWKAAKAQILTATGGLLGAFTALSAESTQAAGDSTAWILPFTSGGFLYIALVSVVPDLLKETSPKESVKQLLLLGAGIMTMVGVTFFVE